MATEPKKSEEENNGATIPHDYNTEILLAKLNDPNFDLAAYAWDYKKKQSEQRKKMLRNVKGLIYPLELELPDREGWEKELEKKEISNAQIANQMAILEKLGNLESVKGKRCSTLKLSLEQVGDLWRESKNKFCYEIGERSDRHKIVRYLAINKGFQQTTDISRALEGKNEQTIRKEIGKIRNEIRKYLKIDGKRVIEGRKGSGYKIGSGCQIKLVA